MIRFLVPIVLVVSASLICLSAAEVVTCSGIVPKLNRSDNISISDFGGVGDGKTLNTKAFRSAMSKIEQQNKSGGTLLYVPAGVYLTEPINLTSHMTLFLAKGAVIKATQDVKTWPLVPPLPSYGRGRDGPGPRYISFINGAGLHDVVITGECQACVKRVAMCGIAYNCTWTGENGTIDGQGDIWWKMFRRKHLQYTRPSILEFINSQDITISNVTVRDSPFWNIHPIYCSNVVIHFVTILAPYNSYNTDGIDPDSCSNVCIEDSYISNGDDIVAIKSGWDEYGIAYSRPSSNITVRRITGTAPFAGIAVGSETSGGVENVLFEDINLYNMGYGIHIKTNIGRGGIIQNITVSDVYMEKVRTGVRILGNVGGHPDDKFDPDALPVVKDITIKNLWGENVEASGWLKGIKKSPFTGIFFSNITLHGVEGKRSNWKCSDVSGKAFKVNPLPCPELSSSGETGSYYNNF